MAVCSGFRLIVLCALAAWLGLTTHVVADATGDFPHVPEVNQDAAESSVVEADPSAADSALPPAANAAGSEPQVSLLNHPSLTRLAWFSPPPVRPPIVLN